MSAVHNLASILNGILGRFDIVLTRNSRLKAMEEILQPPNTSRRAPALPESAVSYLRPINPRFIALVESYRDAVPAVMRPSRWTDDYQTRHIDISAFRSDNAYVFSDRNNESSYALTSYYLASFDRLNLLNTLIEDGMFGAKTFMYRGDQVVSRDLLDSINEIYFLLSHLPMSALQDGAILDIGAGYGRLAHRLTEALPSIKEVICVDPVPLSTFLCEYYLKFRDVGRATTVAFPEIEAKLSSGPVSLAMNIHSFSECPLGAIEWWLRLVRKYRIPYLLLVPNAADHGGQRLLSQEVDGTRSEYLPILDELGYKRTALAPKYEDKAIQRLGVSPTHYHFFQLQ